MLLLVTTVVAIESELLVKSLEEATAGLGVTALFTGVILLPLIGGAIANLISIDGRSNWLEGKLLLATYTILGLAFYFHPVYNFEKNS